MNYAEIKKKHEQRLNDAQAKLLAKKKIIEDSLSKKAKLEKECQEKLGISLNQVKGEIESLQNQLNSMMEELNREVDVIEQKLSGIS